MKKILLLFVLAIVTLASCRKDIDTFTPNTPAQVVNLNASFKGIIVDESGDALKNVEIKIGTSTTMTDDQGFFVLKNQEVQKDKAFVQATKDGFFSGSRTLLVQKNEMHTVRIMMMSDASIGSVDNATGGTVTLPNGSKVTFPTDGVAHEDGTAYSGTVYVSAKYIDPSTLEGQMRMPGDLRAINNETQQQALTSYGMMAVELKDGSGTLLQVAANKSVELQIQIPSEGMSNAPESLPMWYFDNDKAAWIEEGSAQKVGDKFVGDVRHFSFWNADYPEDYTSINLNFTDDEGNPIPNLQVLLSSPGVNYNPGYGWTNTAGYVGGIIPSGVVLTMTVSSACGAVLMTQDIGPFDTETTLDFSIVDLSVYPHVTGTLVECDGVTPVTDGYISFVGNYWWNNNYVTVDENGNFDFDYASCIADDITEVSLLGYDVNNLTVSDLQIFTLSAEVNLGNVLTCTDLEEYFHVTNAAGDTYTNVDPFMEVGLDSLMTNNIVYYMGLEDNTGQLGYYFGGDVNPNDVISGIGTYTDMVAYGYGFISSIGMEAAETQWTLNVDITSFPDNIDEYLIGSGTAYSENTGETYDISFKIKREN